MGKTLRLLIATTFAFFGLKALTGGLVYLVDWGLVASHLLAAVVGGPALVALAYFVIARRSC